MKFYDKTRSGHEIRSVMAKQMTMGVIVGNRGFFPSHLATSGRLEMIAALEAKGIKPIVLTPEETAHGAVETYEDAKKCADLFKKNAPEIDGIIITDRKSTRLNSSHEWI